MAVALHHQCQSPLCFTTRTIIKDTNIMENRKAMYDLPESFPEEDFLRDGPMDHEIVRMSVEAANKQGFPNLTTETIWSNPEHTSLMIDYLKDCRPLPIILDMIKKFESGNRNT